MSFRLAAASAGAGAAAALSKATGRGRGETLNGRVLLALYPSALEELASGRDIVLVSGTNGKTTTTRLIARLLEEEAGERVSTSLTGANMVAGIAAALNQVPRHRLAVLECDELYLPAMYARLSPKVVVLLNLSRDQLHRTGEVRKVAQRWHESLNRPDVSIVIDRDDPFLEYAVVNAGHVIRVSFGGRRHPDATTCPQCGQLLDWGTGDYRCSCGLGAALADVRGDQRLGGPARNAVLAVEAARLMGAEIDVSRLQEVTSEAPDRIANLHFGERIVPTRLAKNPQSWREALAAVCAPNVVLALNARGIDGRDTSWLWDVDYAVLAGRRVICTGERAADIAYRVAVAGAEVSVADSFAIAVAKTAGPVEAIASYTAFQDEVRQHKGVSA